MNISIVRICIAFFGTGVLGTLATSAAAAPPIQISKPTGDLIEGSPDAHRLPAFSPRADLVAFASSSPRLVAGDTNNLPDIFLWSRATGAIRLLTVGTNGAANGASYDPALSKDGRFVAFATTASNLLSDTNKSEDVYVVNLQTGAYELATVPVNTQPAASRGLDSIRDVVISDTGRYVACAANRLDIFAATGKGKPRVFLRDREAGANIAINAPEGVDKVMRPLRFTDDVLWFASETNIYTFNLSAHTTNFIARVNVSPAFSPDGTKVALQYATASSNTVQLHDRITGQTKVVFASSNKVANYRSLSVANNGAVAFLGYSGATNRTADVYVVDALGNPPTRISLVPTADGVTDYAADPMLLPDGRQLYFKIVTPVGLNRPQRIDLYAAAVANPNPQKVLGSEFMTRFSQTPDGVLAIGLGTDFGFTNASQLGDLAYLDGAPLIFLELSRAAEGWRIVYPSSAGAAAAVQYRDTLSTGDWTNLGIGPIESNGQMTVTDPSNSTERYYRILTQP